MDVNLLESLQAMSREDYEGFLQKELATLPLHPRARHVLHAIARLAPLRDHWVGSRKQIADAIVLLCGDSCSVETVDRGVDEIYLRGLISTAGKNGAKLTYTIHWSAILDTPRPPQLIEEQYEPPKDAPTKTDHLRRHPTAPVVDHGQPREAPPDRGQASGNRGHDHGQRPQTVVNKPSGHGHRGASANADAVLNKSKSASALRDQRAPARPGQRIWRKRIKPEEWRDPESLIPNLFDQLVLTGVLKACDDDRLALAALIFCVAGQSEVINKAGLLTTILQGTDRDVFGRPWNARASIVEEEAARLMLKRIDAESTPQPKPDAYTAQAQEANDERVAMEKRRAELSRRLKEEFPKAFSTARSPAPGGGVR